MADEAGTAPIVAFADPGALGRESQARIEGYLSAGGEIGRRTRFRS